MDKLFDFQFLFDVTINDDSLIHVGYAGTTKLECDDILTMCIRDATITYGDSEINVVSFNYQLQNEQKKVD